MSSANPTLDAAESSTGIEPLNSAPKNPVPMKQGQQDPQAERLEEYLTKLEPLPARCDSYTFPLSLASKNPASKPHPAALPDSSAFEGIVQEVLHPAGPVRAEEVGKVEKGGEVEGLVKRVKDVVGGEVKVFKTVEGVGKEEWHVAGLVDGSEGVVVVRYQGLAAKK